MLFRSQIVGRDPDVVADPPALGIEEADLVVMPVDDRQDAQLLGELDPVHAGVQERDVHGVHGVLSDLEPVAGHGNLVGHQLAALDLEGVVDREWRLFLGRPNIFFFYPLFLSLFFFSFSFLFSFPLSFLLFLFLLLLPLLFFLPSFFAYFGLPIRVTFCLSLFPLLI